MSNFGLSSHRGVGRRYRWPAIVSVVALAAGAAAFSGAAQAAAAPTQPPAGPTAGTTFTATTSIAEGTGVPSGIAIGDLHDTSAAALAANAAACSPGVGIPALPGCVNDLVVDGFGSSGGPELDVATKDAGDSGFTQTATAAPLGNLPYGVAIGDFNGDGINDLVEANSESDSLYIFYGNGSGGYGYSQAITLPDATACATPFVKSVAVGDLGNGRADIVATVINGCIPSGGHLAVLMNNGVVDQYGQATFTETDLPTGTSLGSAPVDVVIGDLGNGRNDIAVADFGDDNLGEFGNPGVDVFMNNGGGFTTPGGYTSEFLNTGLPAQPHGDSPVSIAIGDFNGDGRPDLVTADYGGGISVFMNQGRAKFTQTYIPGDPTATLQIAAGDLNGDGLADFATVDESNDVLAVYVTSLDPASTSPAGISFTKTVLPTGVAPSAIAIGHLNSADGANDIAITNFSSNNVEVYTNTTPQAPPVVRDSGSALASTAKVAGLAVKTGDLAVAYVSADGPKTGGQTAFVSGGGLNWTLAARENGEPGDSEVWSARVPAGTPKQITVTATAGIAGYKVALTAVSYSHADGIGATAAVGGSHAPSATLTTTAGNSWVWAVGTDWLSATARKVGAGQTLVQQNLTASDETYWVQSQTVPTGAAGTSVKSNDTAPSTDPYNLVAVEIIP